MGWRNNFWNSLRGPDAITLRKTFESLSKFLDDPTFDNGITVGSGSADDGVPGSGGGTRVITPTDIVPDDEATPGVPTGLAVTAGIGSLRFTWDANTEADMVDGYGSYTFQWSSDPTFATGTTTTPVGVTFISITGLTTGTTYYGRVLATDAHGNSSAYSDSVNDIPITITIPDLDTDINIVPDDDGDPASVTGLSVSAGFKSLWVNWIGGTEVDVEDHWGYYQIQIATDAAFTSVIGDVTAKTTYTSFTDLSTENTYYVRVKTFDAHGNSSGWSSYVSGEPVAILNADIGVGQITEDSIADFAVVAKKFNTVSHQLY